MPLMELPIYLHTVGDRDIGNEWDETYLYTLSHSLNKTGSNTMDAKTAQNSALVL
jgi:hypothetical protein